MTDEERYPPPYEQAALAEFRRTQLPARERLRAQSRELHRHYAGATACTPSRTTLFTGQYASLHGVADTDGLAKAATDPAMHFLDPDTVPTMGDWFRAVGYRTHYRGKWHISHPDLYPFPGTPREPEGQRRRGRARPRRGRRPPVYFATEDQITMGLRQEEPLHRRGVRRAVADPAKVESVITRLPDPAAAARPSCGSSTTTTTASTARPRWSRSGRCTNLTADPEERTNLAAQQQRGPHPRARAAAVRSSNRLRERVQAHPAARERLIRPRADGPPR